MATANIYDLVDTWNDGLTTFTAIKMDVTDTASASGSLLMDLQVGSASKFKVEKTGAIVAVVGANQPYLKTQFNNYHLQYDGNGGWEVVLNGTPRLTLAETVSLGSVGALRWTSVLDSGTTPDLFLTRKGAANLRFGAADAAAPVAQTLSVQSVVAGTSNTSGQNFTIQGSAGTGLGAGGSIIFQVAPASGSGTGQNTLVDALTIGSTGRITFHQQFQELTTANLFHFILTGSSSNPRLSISGAGVFLGSGGHIAWKDNVASSSGTADTFLYRDAANTLALRNGANAQTFNIYNTFTDATNYERFSIIAQSGGAVQIGTNKGSVGGTARALELQTDGQTRLTITTSGVVNIGNNPFKVLGSFAVTSGYNSVLWSDGILGWGSGVVSETTTPDTCLQRDGAPDKLALKRSTNAQEFRVYKTTTGTVYKALLGDNNLIKISGEAFTDGAGASTGTLTNAPAAGNPTKWIPIDDNGTTRYIPAW